MRAHNPGVGRPVDLSPAVVAAFEHALPGAVRTRVTDRLGMAHDASHYLLRPQAVVVAGDAAHVAALLRVATQHGIPLTFRSGGTSLSGQAGTPRVLVDTRRHFRRIEVLDGGAKVRVEPGLTLRQVNARLAPYGQRLGPDPASESACTIGGVIANNSSGMTCGTESNTYATLDSLVAVLPSGTVIDTGAPDADQRFRALEPALARGLERLRDRIRGNPDSVSTIRRQFAMKNTMGYGLNAFLDHERPAELLAHLVIGSEGTLAFVSEATFRTVPVRALALTGLLTFRTLHDAAAAVPGLLAASPNAIELLDAESLRVAQADPAADPALRAMRVTDDAALLVEWQADDADILATRFESATKLSKAFGLSSPMRLSGDPAARAALWHLRKGLYATVAGARPRGTTALLEDVAVPVEAMADLCARLTQMFEHHGYERSVIFGHAKDGNLHFMLNERFDANSPPVRYAAFTEDMVDAVLARGGTLKAEHGTGRVMAPFVRRQYGDELYDVMRELKRLLDPHAILNPGVILSDDDTIHLHDLKSVPEVEAEVDRCVECGYCEPVCPSRDLTTTPRQRIVLRRELAAAAAAGDQALVDQLETEYTYDAVETCAVDGMCATACPVLINTGDLTKRLRSQGQGVSARAPWRLAASHWGLATTVAARTLDLAAALPAPIVEGAAGAARAVVGEDRIPQWRRDLPRGGRRRKPQRASRPVAVYLPSCLNSLFSSAPEGVGVMAAMQILAQRAGIELRIPSRVADLCCGTPWSSKGLVEGYAAMQRKTRQLLEEATDGGRLPVITDAASCTEGLSRLLDTVSSAFVVQDVVRFVADQVLPRLTVHAKLPSIVLHPTCSSRRLELDDVIRAVAGQIADEVCVPADWQCCAFAGDRGMLHPELTASATREEAQFVRARAFSAHASVNRTCEIGMTRATGRTYVHVIELVERATRRVPPASPK